MTNIILRNPKFRTYENARQYEVGKVVERPPPDLQVERDVDVGVLAALVETLVPGHGEAAEVPLLECRSGNQFLSRVSRMI